MKRALRSTTARGDRSARRRFFRMLAVGTFAGFALSASAPTKADGTKADGGSASTEAKADGGSTSTDAARRARIALKVGERTITVGELEDRLAGIPPFQLATFGASPRDVVDAYVQQVLVRDLLLAEGAHERRLDTKEPALHQLARTRSSATLRAVRRDLGTPSSISDADVRAYYDAHLDRFDAPERVNLWRILCATEADARAVLDEASRDLTTTRFNDLARERSLDRATKFRGGNLGFLDPKGVSNQAGLTVDPALVKAAAEAKEGALVPHPVAEGDAFAVVWRRATVPATRRSLDDAAPEIRATLYRERAEAGEKKLIDELRQKHVRDVDPSLLGIIVLPVFDAGMTPRTPAITTPAKKN